MLNLIRLVSAAKPDSSDAVAAGLASGAISGGIDYNAVFTALVAMFLVRILTVAFDGTIKSVSRLFAPIKNDTQKEDENAKP